MKKILFIVAVIFSFSANVSAQNVFSVKETGIYGRHYMIDGQRVPYETFTQAMADDQREMFDSGRSLYTGGQIIGCIGASMVGWDLGGRLAKSMNPPHNGTKETNDDYTLLIAGGGITVVGIIMSAVGNKQMKKALTLHDNPFTDGSIELGFTKTGIGLSMRF